MCGGGCCWRNIYCAFKNSKHLTKSVPGTYWHRASAVGISEGSRLEFRSGFGDWTFSENAWDRRLPTPASHLIRNYDCPVPSKKKNSEYYQVRFSLTNNVIILSARPKKDYMLQCTLAHDPRTRTRDFFGARVRQRSCCLLSSKWRSFPSLALLMIVSPKIVGTAHANEKIRTSLQERERDLFKWWIMLAIFLYKLLK